MKILCAMGLLLAGTFQAYGMGKPNMQSAEEPVCEKVAGRENEMAPFEQEDISRLQIGGNYTHASIRIKDQPLFHGNLGGAQGIYEYRPWNNFYGALSASWKQDRTKSSIAARKLQYIDAHERLGYTYASSCRNWVLSAFTGLGYRHLKHRLMQTGETIKFYYNEFYIPVGAVSQYYFNSWFAGGLNFTWMPQVYSTVKIVPLNGARWIIKRSLNNFLVEVPVTFFFTENKAYSLVFKPFYEYWRDGKSTAKSPTGLVLGLPGNSYNFWGAELNFGFSF